MKLYIPRTGELGAGECSILQGKCGKKYSTTFFRAKRTGKKDNNQFYHRKKQFFRIVTDKQHLKAFSFSMKFWQFSQMKCLHVRPHVDLS